MKETHPTTDLTYGDAVDPGASYTKLQEKRVKGEGLDQGLVDVGVLGSCTT